MPALVVFLRCVYSKRCRGGICFRECSEVVFLELGPPEQCEGWRKKLLIEMGRKAAALSRQA
eukprot:scaffold121941_cov35-Tisochrysis_lutea.AAC.2